MDRAQSDAPEGILDKAVAAKQLQKQPLIPGSQERSCQPSVGPVGRCGLMRTCVCVRVRFCVRACVWVYVCVRALVSYRESLMLTTPRSARDPCSL